jgi:hypothetical protein
LYIKLSRALTLAAWLPCGERSLFCRQLQALPEWAKFCQHNQKRARCRLRIYRVQAEVLLTWQIEQGTEEQRIEIDTRIEAAEVAATLGLPEAEVQEAEVLSYVLSQQPEGAEAQLTGSAYELSIAEVLELAGQPSLFDLVAQ